MSQIKYEFDAIMSSLDNLSSKSNEIDSLIDSVSSFSCNVDEIAAALEAAKAKTINALNSIKTSIQDSVTKTRNLCNDYQAFENKMLNHPIFGLSFDVTTTVAPEGAVVSDDSIVLGSDNVLEVKDDEQNFKSEMKTYTIKEGDSLSKIAKNLNIYVEDLYAANKDAISNPDLIYAGNTLIIPEAATLVKDVNDTTDVEQPTESDESEEPVSSDGVTDEVSKAQNDVSMTQYSSKPDKGFVVTTNNKKYQLSDSDYDLICAIVAAESDGSGDDALAVVTTMLNRCESSRWKWSGGSDIVAQATKRGQYVVYEDKVYLNYLNGKAPAAVKTAVSDALNGVRNHSYYSFKSNETKEVGDNMITATGNRFH